MKQRTKEIAASSTFGALSAIAAFAPLSFPFPLIPYLKFDLAEIPVTFAFLTFGPVPGIVSSILYLIILNFFGQFAPIGPTLKFLAVVSMLLGIWVGGILSRKLKFNLLATSILIGIFSIIIRVVILTVANYVVIWILMPEFLKYATYILSETLKTNLEPNIGGLVVVLAFTALFNSLHVLLSLVPSIIIALAMKKRMKTRTWFYESYKS